MKITTKKRLQKALKIGAVALAALVLLVLLVGVGASCIKDRYKNREFITCAAEERKTEVDFPVNYCNTFLFKDRTVSGVTLSVDKNGIFYLSGTPTKERFVFDCQYPAEYVGIMSELLGTSPFFYHSELMGVRLEFCLVIDGVNVYYPRTDMPNSLIPTGNLISVYMNLVVERPQLESFNNDTYYVSLYKNANSNFYTPSLLGYYDMAYNNGYDIGRQDGNEKGYENGYEDGYGAGVEDSVFFGVSVTAALQKLDGSYEKAYTASPRKSSETFDFGFLTDYFKRNYTEGNYMACSLSLTFEKPVPYYTYLFEMHDLSGALAQLCTVVAEDGTEYTKFRFSRQEGKTGQLEYWGDNIEALKTLKIKQIKDIYLSFPLFDFSPFQSLSMTYKDVAYENGYAIGKQEGEDNAVFTFDNLKSGFFSILDAPFKTIKDALNFEFLGINISNLVLFLLTVIVVVIIIKKAVGK